MYNITRIILSPGKEEPLRRNHPWVFSGAIKKADGKLKAGSHVEVFSSRGEYMGCGIYQKATISVRLLAFAPERPAAFDRGFWYRKLLNAYQLRQLLGLTNNPDTTAYRLVHGEGDNLPGLIIDNYDGNLVIQLHSAGLHEYLEPICGALKDIFGDSLKSIYDKSKESAPTVSGRIFGEGSIVEGESTPVLVKEYSNSFLVDIEKGQKTGFFLDQRENRKLLSTYSKNRKVLNTFCYSGGFSVYALKAGASMVHSLDSSAKAIDLTIKNIEINFGKDVAHEAICEDTIEYLLRTDQTYEVVILDPPAYAKHTTARHNAVQGYKRLNLQAFKRIAPGGVLFTFSCSQVVDKALFRSTVMAAAIQSGRKVRILHQLSQPSDHPVNMFHPEGEYLKGLVLFVE